MKNTKYFIIPLTILLLLGTLAISYVYTAQPVNVTASSVTTEGQRTITVVGEGRITAQPDIAQITIGVETVSPEVSTATKETEGIMTRLIETLKAHGVAEKDIQTSNYSIYTNRFGGMEMGIESDVTYQFSNNVTIVVRDLTQIETILGAAIEAGANNIYGINFSLADPSELRKQARAEAVRVAKEKATELATLTDVEVGSVMQVSEVVGYAGPLMNSVAFAQDSRFGGGGPISAGELEFTVQLEVTYAIQ